MSSKYELYYEEMLNGYTPAQIAYRRGVSEMTVSKALIFFFKQARNVARKVEGVENWNNLSHLEQKRRLAKLQMSCG